MDKRSSLGPVTLKGRYRIETVLGQGGFSITYKGMDLKEQAPVAIKEYYPSGLAVRDASVSPEVDCAGDRDFFVQNKERFLREAAVLAQFPDHERVVRILDHFEENNTAYIVMEYVYGITLREHVCKAGGKITWKETAPILNALIETLIPFHKQGIIHRDISPENIMMLPDGGIKLLDFGAVKQVGENVEVGRMLTKPTEAIVKQGYAPIEQYQNRGNLGPWTDVYALCATACYCLTGSVPPDAPARVVTSASVELIERGVDLSEKEEAALRKGMEILVQDRIQSMEELRAALFFSNEKSHNPEESAKRDLIVTRADSGNAESETADSSAAGEKRIFFFRRMKKARLLTVAACLVFLASVIAFGAIAQGRESRYVLREGDDLEACLQRKGVREIVIPEGVSCTLTEAVIRKQVIIEEGAYLCVGNMTVTEKGFVRVEGTLDIENALLHTQGSGRRIETVGGGTLLTDMYTLLWTEQEENIGTADGNGTGGNVKGYQLSADEEKLFADAVSVTSFDELKAAAAGERPISIDADIEVEETIHLRPAVRVREGVTLTHRNRVWIEIGGYGIFINHGTVKGGLSAGNLASVINYGYFDMRDKDARSLWMEGSSILINEGTMDAWDCSRLWSGAAAYNLGTLNAYDFYLLGSGLVNVGEIQVYTGNVMEEEIGFLSTNGSVLYNKGSLIVNAGFGMENHGCIENTGVMRIKEDAVFYNRLLHNQGYLESAYTAKIDGIHGMYYGEGEFHLPWASGVPVFVMKAETVQPDAAEVRTKEELMAALAREDVSQVVLSGEIRLSENLTLEKELLIEGTLILENGTALTAHAARVILLRGGGLTAGRITLSDNAQMIVQEGALLHMEENGSFRLDNQSLLLGRGGEIQMEQASLIAENASCVLLESDLNVDEADVRLSDDAVFLTPSCGEWNAAGMHVKVDGGAEWHLSGTGALEEAGLVVEDGSLIVSAGQFSFTQSTLTIGREGTFVAQYAPIEFCDTEIENDGGIRTHGWIEQIFTLDQTKVRNTGKMVFDALTEVDEHTTIENEGSFHLCVLSGEEFERVSGRIVGNPPVRN
ncbi:MAG: serine/threonine protein kinase [bacterium]|nr:serine/threonine protein kinase [bacterium]